MPRESRHLVWRSDPARICFSDQRDLAAVDNCALGRSLLPALPAAVTDWVAPIAGACGPIIVQCSIVIGIMLAGAVRLFAPHENEADLIYSALGDNEVAVTCGLHVAHDAATAGDRPALEFFRFDVEPHQHVGPDRRFDVPDRAVEVGNPIRLGSRSTRGRPVGHLAGLWIEAAEIATRIVRIPDDVV